MQSTDSGFSENVYHAAALERIAEARELLDASPPAYALAAYVAGVAVECMLLAYLMRSGVPHDAKHNVSFLAERSGFFEGMTSKEWQRLSAYLGEIFTRWQNNHRYRDEAALREFVNKHRLFVIAGRRTTREDSLAYNADILFEAASEIVAAGKARWTPSSTI